MAGCGGRAPAHQLHPLCSPRYPSLFKIDSFELIRLKAIWCKLIWPTLPRPISQPLPRGLPLAPLGARKFALVVFWGAHPGPTAPHLGGWESCPPPQPKASPIGFL